MTDAEKKLWNILRSCQIDGYKFRRQVPIGRFIVDFICHEARLAIEVDGGQHDLSSDEETARTNFLHNEGYRILRFWNNDILESLEGVHAVIDDDLLHCHPHPNPPPSRGRAYLRGAEP
ncbi:MAG: endonuclease domain-containing protein [Alphaproteobacteria bacterium]